MNELTEAIEKTINHLQKSEDSSYGRHSVAKLISLLEKALQELSQSENFDKDLLKQIFAPTGSLQEISIDNSWGNEFLQISIVVDQYIKG